MKALAARLTGSLAAAEDVFQEAAVRIWRQLPQLREGVNLSAYFARVVTNLSMDSRRLRGRQKTDPSVSPEDLPSPTEGAIEGVEEQAPALRLAMGRLPKRQREALVLRYFEELTYPELARELGCSEATARSHVSKAKAALRRKLSRLPAFEALLPVGGRAMPWTCEDTARCLAEDRLLELSGRERESLSRHLGACPTCNARVNEDRALDMLVRRCFSVEVEAESGTGYMEISDEPFDHGEARREFLEADRLRLEGKGRFTELLEGPDLTVYVIEYTLSDGRVMNVGSSRPTGLQAQNMHLDEIEQLRREGKGRLISEKDTSNGLGSFTVAYVLSTGEEVILKTRYPPGPESDRQRVFEEIRRLRQEGRGRIVRAWEAEPGRPWGHVEYTLSDGRTVGVTEQLKPSQGHQPQQVAGA
jgi:RNA polymerase sigma-70 factor (ECF subfamily)